MLTIVASPKVRMINVRLSEQMHEEFKVACELRGVSMSSLLHQFIVRTIREEKDYSPRAFEQALTPALGVPVAPRSQHPIPIGNPEAIKKRRTNEEKPTKKNKRLA